MLHPPPALPATAGRVREFSLTVTEKTIDLAKGIKWSGWMYNGTIPGPVIRVTQGDTVHVTLNNSAAKHPHSLHFHSVHAGTQDGVFQIIPAGGKGSSRSRTISPSMVGSTLMARMSTGSAGLASHSPSGDDITGPCCSIQPTSAKLMFSEPPRLFCKRHPAEWRT